MKKNNVISLENDLNEIKDYNVLFTYEDNDKKYIIYTLGEEDKDGFTKVFAGFVNGDKLLPLQSDNEWEMVDKLINKLDGE